MFVGHFFSMVVRYSVRNVQNRWLGDPRNAILNMQNRKQACSSFFSDEFCSAFRAKYNDVFDATIDEAGMSKSIPRIVRSYVLHHSESARQIRERLMRSRSFCANLAMAFIFSSIINIFAFPLIVHVFLWVGSLLLMIKQRSLDERESKEIYTHFLAI